MKGMSNKLKAFLYVPFAGLFLLLGFFPLQNVHATGMAHDMSSMSQEINCCTGSPTSTTAVLKEEQKLPEKDEDDPEPPQQDPPYAQFTRYAEPEKLSLAYAAGANLLRPPDLVKLYGNYRF